MKVIVYGSMILSIIASILFFEQTLGLSVLLFAIVALTMLFSFLEKHDKVKNKKAYFFTIPILALASTYFLYNEPIFRVINFFLLIGLTAIMLIVALHNTLQLRQLPGKIMLCIFEPLEHISEAVKGMSNTFFKKKEKGTKKKVNERANYIWVGIAISLPLLLIVVALLSSADIVFAEGLQNVMKGLYDAICYILENYLLGELLGRIILILITTIYFVSFVLNVWDKRFVSSKESKSNFTISVEATIFNTVVTVLNIVYGLFCAIQITTLFAKVVPAGLNYAEYARQGFFQLLLISIINFAVILITTKNEKPASKAQIVYRKIMNIMLAAFTTIIIASAFTRMNLYQQEYGYTYLRVLVDFALKTECLLLIPTILYIVKPTFKPLKWYLITVLTMYVLLNFSNIGNFIAKENVNRYIQNDQKIDFYYLTKTGTDGLEHVIRLYQAAPANSDLKRNIRSYLKRKKYQLHESFSFQEWNLSKGKAKKMLDSINLESRMIGLFKK